MKASLPFLALAFLLQSCAGFQYADMQRGKPARFITKYSDVHILQTPSFSAPIVKRVGPGHELIAEGRYDNYLFVRDRGDSGFVEKSYVTDPHTYLVTTYPTDFTVPKSLAPTVWGRASLFIAHHSTMKLQIATDALLETYTPQTIFQFGYTINRVPMGEDSVMFSVQCSYGSGMLGGPDEKAAMNAHVAAYYMATGNLEQSFLSE
jgi:hypothetical protein